MSTSLASKLAWCQPLWRVVQRRLSRPRRGSRREQSGAAWSAAGNAI